MGQFSREFKAFTAACAADRDDDNARLVFADWLQERDGHPRLQRAADQVRACAEVRKAVRAHFTNREPLPVHYPSPHLATTLLIQAFRHIAALLDDLHEEREYGFVRGRVLSTGDNYTHLQCAARRRQTLRLLDYCERHTWGLWPKPSNGRARRRMDRWRYPWEQMTPDRRNYLARMVNWNTASAVIPNALSNWRECDDALFYGSWFYCTGHGRALVGAAAADVAHYLNAVCDERAELSRRITDSHEPIDRFFHVREMLYRRSRDFRAVRPARR